MNKIENDQIIDLCEMAIDIRKLTCRICYCLVSNPLQCSNIRCAAVVCSDCIKSSLSLESVCPFCRLSVDFVNVDQNINFILNNLKIFCYHGNCNIPYKIDQYVKHIKESGEKMPACDSCSSSNAKACSKCRKYTCSECTFLLYCKLCNSNICIKCNSDSNRHICCMGIKDKSCISCSEKADTISSCCNDTFCQQCLEKCECGFLTCKECRKPQCDHQKFCCHNSVQNNECKKCKNKICKSSFCGQKCLLCEGTFCSDCFIECKICKKTVCKSCTVKCDSCNFNNVNSYSCLACNLPSLKKCTTCDKKLCISCWKVCNACSVIYCQEHGMKCSCCEENVCEKHTYKCDQCPNKNSICLKNCTYKCEICSNISTPYCDKEKHTYVHHLKCRHIICDGCVRKCKNCYNPSLLNFYCPICIYSYYEKKILFCNYCTSDYCNNCFRFCRYCSQYYCLYNKCMNCENVVKRCSNCLVIRSRMYCLECKNSQFKVCDDCAGVLLCSVYCYVEYSGKVGHLCEMFNCYKCVNKKLKDGKLVKDTDISISSDISNMSFRGSEMSDLSLYGRRYNEDKVSAGCQESCTCNII
jgi:hypothetical protein